MNLDDAIDKYEPILAKQIVEWLKDYKRLLKEERKTKKLFLVTFNGYHFDPYGSKIYLLGIYSSREKAEEACNKAEFYMKAMSDEYDGDVNKPTIKEVELDEFKRVFEKSSEFRTDVCLGGYAE